MTMPIPYVQCRYMKQHTREQCTAEAVDPLGEVLLCTTHLARAMELVRVRTTRLVRAA